MLIRPGNDDLLLIIDVQNDFCPGGALAVTDGDAVVPVINRVAERFDHIALTQDWHPPSELIIRKGFRPEIDSYSAFFENDRRTPTGLAGYLRDRGLRRIFLVGLATDYCVHFSAVDARRLGFDTVLVEAGCRAIDLAGSLDAAWAGMEAAGVQRVNDL